MNIEQEGSLLDKSKERVDKEKPIDALIVFGGGVLSDKSLDAMDVGHKLIGDPEQGWRLPLGAKMRVLAASELYLGNQTEDVIFTGGAVGSKEGLEKSEAQLMREYFLKKLEQQWRSDLLKEYEVAEGNIRDGEGEIRPDIEQRINEIIETRSQDVSQHVLLEDKATNTIENFAHTINFIDQNSEKYQNIALLSNNFHIGRIEKLAGKMGVEGHGIGSEDVIEKMDPRYEKVAKRYFDPEVNESYRTEVLGELEGEKKTQIESRLGGVAKDYPKSERRWSRGLDEIPEYWLPNVSFIQSPDRLKRVLQAEEKIESVLKQNGIDDIETTDPDKLRQVLASIERVMPPKEWEEK